MNVAFVLLRVFTAIGTLAGLAILLLLILGTLLVGVVKGGVGAITAVGTLFASGFQKSSSGPAMDKYLVAPSLIALAIAFLTMFIAVFLPEQKVYLHIVAALAVIAGGWRWWTATANPEVPWIYLPVIALWLVYYAMCLRRG